MSLFPHEMALGAAGRTVFRMTAMIERRHVEVAEPSLAIRRIDQLLPEPIDVTREAEVDLALLEARVLIVMTAFVRAGRVHTARFTDRKLLRPFAFALELVALVAAGVRALLFGDRRFVLRVVEARLIRRRPEHEH